MLPVFPSALNTDCCFVSKIQNWFWGCKPQIRPARQVIDFHLNNALFRHQRFATTLLYPISARSLSASGESSLGSTNQIWHAERLSQLAGITDL